MIRNSLRLALVGALGLACAAQPAWILRPEQHTHGARYVVAVGTASLTQGTARARIVAEQSARTALAARVSTQVNASIMDSMNEQLDHSGAAVQSAESFRQNLATTVNQSLEGVEILEVYEDPDREVIYALAALDLDALRQRTLQWSSEIELQLAAQRRTLSAAVAAADLAAVDSAVRGLRAVDTSVPAYARMLRAFESSLVLPETSVARDIEAAQAALRRQWPTANTQATVDHGTVRIQLPHWQAARWRYSLRPAGGAAQDLYVRGTLGEVQLPPDAYTDDTGRVAIRLWPESQDGSLAREFVVVLSAVRRPEIRPVVVDAACGESARAAVQVALETCLISSGWRVADSPTALRPTYTLSCSDIQTHNFGTGVVLSSTASLRGGVEASGRAPVLDYSATVVGNSDAQVRASASQRLARAACAD